MGHPEGKVARLMATQVTHVIGQLGRGGAEKQLFRLAAALQKRGWQQSIVAFSPGGVWADRFREVAIPLFMVPRSPIKPWRFWQLCAWFVRETACHRFLVRTRGGLCRPAFCRGAG